MPTSRPPSIRPTTPLSPSSRYEAITASRSPTLAPRSSPAKQASPRHAAPLRLPGLPRYHPANYPNSPHSSFANTPASGPSSPHAPIHPAQHALAQGPPSPALQVKMQNEAQRQLYTYQSNMMGRNSTIPGTPMVEPGSPRLIPLGSPGPVTPFELEGAEGYITSKGRGTVMQVEGLEEEVERKLGSRNGSRTALGPTRTR